ncbi:MAG: hypothetical protein WAN61_01375 [Minisyncoccia bacterium]
MAFSAWALKRQIFYVVVLLVFIFIFGFLIISPSLNKAPSCVDGIQNGDETGIDCGGSCPNACLSQVDTVSVLWARAFEVAPGRYNAVAYIVNHNKTDAAEKVSYRFRFADANNIYIGMSEGTTDIPISGNFAVFAPGIDVGNSIPIYTSFEFTETPQWIQVPQDKIDQIKVEVSDIKLSNEATSPEISAMVKNDSLFIIPNVNVVALLYDGSGNVLSGSSTYLSQLSPLQTANINFTWPEPFSGAVVQEELIPEYDIFSAKLE